MSESQNDGSVIIDIALDYSSAKKGLQEFEKQMGSAGKAVEQGLGKNVANTRQTLLKLQDAQKQLSALFKSGAIDSGEYNRLRLQITDAAASVMEMEKKERQAGKAYEENRRKVDEYTAELNSLDAQLTAIKDQVAQSRGIFDFFSSDQDIDAAIEKIVSADKGYQKLSQKAEKAAEKVDLYTQRMNEAGSTSNDFSKEAGDAAQSADVISENIKKAGDSATHTAPKIGTLQIAFGNLVAEGIKLAISGLKDFIGMGIEYASNLEVVEDRIDNTFGEKSAAQIREWADNSIEKMGLAEGNAKNYAVTLGEMAKGLGMSDAKTRDLSISSTELIGRFADLRGFKPEDLFTDITSALSGGGEGLREYGIRMDENTLKHYLLSQGIRGNISDMSESERVWYRYQYVIEKGNEILGDAAIGSNSYNAQLNATRETMKALSGTFVSQFLPAITEALGEVNTYLNENGDALANLGSIVSTIIGVLTQLLKVVASVPPELLIMVGIVLLAVTTYTKMKKALTPAEGALKSMGVSMGQWSNSADAMILKVLAVIAALSVLLFLILSLKDGTDKTAASMSSLGTAAGNMSSQAQNAARQPRKGYAKGTKNAATGWFWVGEDGPELMRFAGGEQVMNAVQSAQYIRSGLNTSYGTASGSYAAPPPPNNAYTHNDHSQMNLSVSGIRDLDEIISWWRNKRIQDRKR